MSTQILNLIIALAAFFVVFIPFTGEAFRKSNSFLKKITIRGWVIIVFSMLGGWAAIEKDQLAEDKGNLEKQVSQKEQITRDTIAERKRLESNKEIAKVFSDALGKWGYKLDSQNNAIEKIVRDSTTKEDEPFIEMFKDGIPGLKYERMDSLYFQFGVNNPKPSTIAYNVHVSLDFIIKNHGKFILSKRIADAFPTHPSISPLTHINKLQPFEIHGTGNYIVDTIFIKAEMYCTNYSKKIARLRDEFDVVIISQKLWAQYDYNIDQKLYSFLKEKNLYK